MGIERRTETREPFALDVKVLGGGCGTTRNISQRGLLFETDTALPLGSEVDLEILFASAGGELSFQTRGTVVRLETVNRTHRVAVRMLDARLMPLD